LMLAGTLLAADNDFSRQHSEEKDRISLNP
jgi:hypothetical protein